MKLASSSSQKTKKTLAVLLSVLLISGAGYVAYAMSNSLWPFSSRDSQPVATANSDLSEQQHGHTGDASTEDGDKNDTNDTSPTDKTPAQYDQPDDDTPSDRLTGVINYKSVSGGTLVVRNTINQSVTAGTCEMVMTHQPTNETVTRKAQIVVNPHSSTCQGFDIPTSELASGIWDIKITIISGNKTGTVKDSVTI